MKIEKKDLTEAIDDIVANGVIESEEIDVTTQKIMSVVWPIIQYLKDQNNKP